MGVAVPMIPGYTQSTVLDRGGFSTVYRARQTGFDRWVAIKVLNTDLDDRQRDAFERECRAMGVVSQHPNIVTVLSAAYTDDGRPALVMELYGGGTYAQRLRREGPLPAAEVLSLGVRIGAALQSAHDRGLLHRDVKPQNLFLSDYGEPALGDFGISAFRGDDTTSGALTINYAAPEVIERREASPATDVYALAATLYTLVAGRRPFARSGVREQPSDVALRILRDPPPRIGDSCPPPLERALLQGLAKQPGDRPDSAGDLARLLQQVQGSLGLDRTELALARTVDDAQLTVTRDQLGAHGHLDADDSATVVRPRATTPGGSPASVDTATPAAADADEDAPSRARSRRSTLVGAVAAVAVLGGVGWAVGSATNGGEDPQDAPAVEAGSPGDAAEVAPPVRVQMPEDLAITRRGDDEVVVSWDALDGLRYEVERVDGDHDARWSSEDGEVVIDGLDDDARPCVVVRAITAAGQLSTAAGPVCAGAG